MKGHKPCAFQSGLLQQSSKDNSLCQPPSGGFFICGVYMDSATFGNVLLTIVGFLIVYTLNGIKAEIKEVKQSMNKLADELQKIDKRVVALEASK